MSHISFVNATAIAVALAVVNAAVLLLIVIRRLRLDRRRSHEAVVEDNFRSHAVNLLTATDQQAEQEAERMLRSLPASDQLTAGLLVGRYARLTRGPEHIRAMKMLRRCGVVDLAYADAMSARAPYQRYRACMLLGKLGEPQARAVLESCLQDRNASVRAGASRALGYLGLPECAPALVAAFNDRNLIPLGVAEAALAELGAASAPAFVRGLQSSESVVRAASCHGLTSSSDQIWIALDLEERLIQLLLHDPAVSVRHSAAVVLGERGMNESGSAGLQRALGDADESVRACAARALAAYEPTPHMSEKLYHLASAGVHVPALAAARTLLHHGLPAPANWATMRARMTLEAIDA